MDTPKLSCLIISWCLWRNTTRINFFLSQENDNLFENCRLIHVITYSFATVTDDFRMFITFVGKRWGWHRSQLPQQSQGKNWGTEQLRYNCERPLDICYRWVFTVSKVVFRAYGVCQNKIISHLGRVCLDGINGNWILKNPRSSLLHVKIMKEVSWKRIENMRCGMKDIS